VRTRSAGDRLFPVTLTIDDPGVADVIAQLHLFLDDLLPDSVLGCAATIRKVFGGNLDG